MAERREGICFRRSRNGKDTPLTLLFLALLFHKQLKWAFLPVITVVVLWSGAPLPSSSSSSTPSLPLCLSLPPPLPVSLALFTPRTVHRDARCMMWSVACVVIYFVLMGVMWCLHWLSVRKSPSVVSCGAARPVFTSHLFTCWLLFIWTLWEDVSYQEMAV